MTPSLSEQITELRREVTLRTRLYPRWVQARSLSQAQADTQLERMKAALGTLLAVKEASERDCKPPPEPETADLFGGDAPF